MQSSICLLVACHKATYVPPHPLLYPIQAGTALSNIYLPDAWHDNEYENISDRNSAYCELTAVYWAWKNLRTDYIGLMHYRRYFCFESGMQTSTDGIIHMPGPLDNTPQLLGYNRDRIQKMLQKHAVILPCPVNIYRMTRYSVLTVRDQYGASPGHDLTHLDRAVEVACRMHPDYKQDTQRYLDAEYGWFYNMFIMRQAEFSAYCEWLFPILDTLYSENPGQEGTYEGRMVGFVAERLLGIYMTHLRRTRKDIQIAYLPVAMFDEGEAPTPEQQDPLSPLSITTRLWRLRYRKYKASQKEVSRHEI